MHCFGHSTYAVQINTKLVFLLEAFGENEWFVLRMKGAYVSAYSCLSAASFCLRIQRWNSSFVSARADGLETTRLIREDEQSSSASARGQPYKLYYLLRLLSTSSFLYCGTRRKAAFFYFFTYAFENITTYRIALWKWKTTSVSLCSNIYLKIHFSKFTLSPLLITNMLFDVEFQLKTKH